MFLSEWRTRTNNEQRTSQEVLSCVIEASLRVIPIGSKETGLDNGRSTSGGPLREKYPGKMDTHVEGSFGTNLDIKVLHSCQKTELSEQ